VEQGDLGARMGRSRRITLAALVTVATAWSACMVILGLWLIGQGWRHLPMPRPMSAMGGLMSISGGLLIFMAAVADRVIPGVGRRLSMWPVEMVAAMVMAVSFVVVLISYGGALS
jgi:hypothetical protein